MEKKFKEYLNRYLKFGILFTPLLYLAILLFFKSWNIVAQDSIFYTKVLIFPFFLITLLIYFNSKSYRLNLFFYLLTSVLVIISTYFLFGFGFDTTDNKWFAYVQLLQYVIFMLSPALVFVYLKSSYEQEIDTIIEKEHVSKGRLTEILNYYRMISANYPGCLAFLSDNGTYLFLTQNFIPINRKLSQVIIGKKDDFLLSNKLISPEELHTRANCIQRVLLSRHPSEYTFNGKTYYYIPIIADNRIKYIFMHD